MLKLCVFSAILAFASAGILAPTAIIHETPIVAAAAAPGIYHKSIQAQTIVDHPQVKTVIEPAPLLHAAPAHPLLHAPLIAPATPIVKAAPILLSGPQVQKSVHATSIVHEPPVIHTSLHAATPIVHHSPLIQIH